MLQHDGALKPFANLFLPALKESKVSMVKSDITEHFVSHFYLKYIRYLLSALIRGQLAAAAANHVLCPEVKLVRILLIENATYCVASKSMARTQFW